MTRPRPARPPAVRGPLARLGVFAAAALLVASGCTDGGGSGTGAASDGGGASDAGTSASAGTDEALSEIGTTHAADLQDDPASDPAYAEYYDQDISWGPCEDVSGGDSLECGTLTVPRAWDDPSAGDVEIAVARQGAVGSAQGTLVVNPGGPGGSGADMAAQADAYFSADLMSAYDVVGFDPRGVGRSEGIDCLTDAELDTMRADSFDLLTEDGETPSTPWVQRLADGCEADPASKALLPYLDTASTARDLDVLRAAVGSETLDYFGYSYGTFLGSTYAGLYPDRVGHMVLDGAVDPTLTADQFNAGQADGFEKATRTFLQDCLDQGEECPFTGDVDEATGQLQDLFTSLEKDPLPTGDAERPLTASLARSAVLMLMYDDSTWQYGREGLAAALDGDGSILLNIADRSASRNADGTYSGNANEAITAINCLDRPGVASEEWQASAAEDLAAKDPVWGSSFTYAGETCAHWPVPALREPAEVTADGAAPIVVVGTTGDPATPYAWAQSLADQLSSGVLVTFEGNGHTAYGRSGGCVEKAVDGYLLRDEVPEDGTTC